MNVEGIVLKLLLQQTDRETSLSQFSKLKNQYFSSNFVSLFKHITAYYGKHGVVPSSGDLAVFRSRDAHITAALQSLETLDAEHVDNDTAIEALIDQFAQNTTLDLIEKLVKEISLLDRHEIMESVGAMPQVLDEALDDPEKVYSPKNIRIFVPKAETEADCVPIGISNEWDAKIGGFYRQDLLLVGGKRGDGKSIVMANLAAAQYLRKKTSIFFTIEMTGQETFQRIMSILSGVSFDHIKKNTYDLEEAKQLARTRADMFVEGMEVYKKHFENQDISAPDYIEFENELATTCEEQPHKIIIIDDRDLSLSAIDVQITKIRAKVGDDLTMCIVDYLNQIKADGVSSHEMYDWKPQIHVSKTLKNYARKHNLVMVSPFQMEEQGGVRFSKGIEDACDATLKLNNNKDLGILELATAKARSSDDSLQVGMGIDWDCLRINPTEVDIRELQQKFDGEFQEEQAANPKEEQYPHKEASDL